MTICFPFRRPMFFITLSHTKILTRRPWKKYHINPSWRCSHSCLSALYPQSLATSWIFSLIPRFCDGFPSSVCFVGNVYTASVQRQRGITSRCSQTGAVRNLPKSEEISDWLHGWRGRVFCKYFMIAIECDGHLCHILIMVWPVLPVLQSKLFGFGLWTVVCKDYFWACVSYCTKPKKRVWRIALVPYLVRNLVIVKF